MASSANGSLRSRTKNGISDSPIKQSKVEENGHVQQGEALTYDPAPRTQHYEFMGPPGAFFISTTVPFFTYFCALGCDDRGCPALPLVPFLRQGLQAMGTASFWKSLWDLEGVQAYFVWYAWCVACWVILPGRWMEGSKLRNGEKLWYKINAFQTLLATVAVMGITVYAQGVEHLLFIVDHWVGLVTGAMVMSVFQATACYASSFVPGTMLAEGGNTGNILYDWFIGRSLNPRIGIFDIKTFNEIRPGLILWLILDVALAGKQYSDLGRLTDSMVLVLLFHAIYIFDAVYNEAGIMTQMDITTDGFGFMLSVGDLPWVPFTYCLQARYLAYYPLDLGVTFTCAILAVNALGYYIFRVSNAEKNDFRNGKNPKNLTYMETKRGTNLLTSGWWGRSRHPNYFGDLVMALAWCLPTGFDTPLTYFYVVYFAILLIHRQMRDDEACKRKYGSDWDRYCSIVQWKIIPGVY